MLERRERESGEIMLEALIVYTVTIFLLFLILALFFVFYHIWNMQVIANETAALAAQTYKLETAEVDTGYVSESQVAEIDEYRYLLSSEKELENAVKKRICDYADERLNRTSFVNKLTDTEITVDVKKDGLGSRHIEVVIKEKFEVPFGSALSYFGFESEVTYETKAYAECVDLMDYITMIDYTKEATDLDEFGSFISMINSILKLYNHITE